MNMTQIRKQLHQRIDALPDEIVEQIADFTLFIMARKKSKAQNYAEWDENQWQALSLEQFFREEDDVEYTLADAQEVYHP